MARAYVYTTDPHLPEDAIRKAYGLEEESLWKATIGHMREKGYLIGTFLLTPGEQMRFNYDKFGEALHKVRVDHTRWWLDNKAS